MITPLRIARKEAGLTLKAVVDSVGGDTGNLSRLERAKQKATPDLAARLALFFKRKITEEQILYPERFMQEERRK